jgi:colicin import membrane protein
MHAIEAREQRNAFAGALAVHLFLAAGLLGSFYWSSQSPQTVQAELWSSLPPLAAGPVTAQPTPAPKPEPKPQTTPKTAPAKVAPPAPSQADIALEKKKEAQRKEAQKLEAQKLEAQKLEARRQEAKRAAEEKAAADRLRREQEAAAQLAEQQLKEKLAAERLAQQRKAELARLGIDPNAKSASSGKSAVTKAGVADGAEIGARTGEAAQYADMIRSHVRSRIQFDPQRLPGNPEVIFIVEQLPTGQITSVTKRKSSGSIAWDNAVERAIRASDPLPKKKDGTVERVLDLRFRPKEER